MAQRASVLGLGATGIACVAHLYARGYTVTALDSRAAPPEAARCAERFPEVRVLTGGWCERAIAEADMVVFSPGLAPDAPPVAAARARGQAVLGDIELFARSNPAPVVAVTGTNGKSTVTALAGAMLARAGLTTAVGGNIGKPALELLDADGCERCVLELSSFQLEVTDSLEPLAAAFLNLSPDHLDRHVDLERYAAIKRRVFRGASTAVCDRADPRTRPEDGFAGGVVSVGLDDPGPEGYGVRELDGRTWLVVDDEPLVAVEALPVAGAHNVYNVLSACALALAAGGSRQACKAAACAFEPLPHRCTPVARCAGVRWVDDSKATNVGACRAAVTGLAKGTERRLIVIAGGDGKGADFSALHGAFAAHVRAAVLIGRDAARLESALADVTDVHMAGTLEAAVERARALAVAGDTVVLAPACASFDQFTDYAARGERFVSLVRALGDGRAVE